MIFSPWRKIVVKIISHILPERVFQVSVHTGLGRLTEVFNVLLPELLKRLFAMTNDDTAEVKLAPACLTAIDDLQDE